MRGPVQSAIEQAVGDDVATAVAVAGGDINEAYKLTLASGRTVFAKTHATAPPSMFVAEARGLRWLASAQALRVPEVIAVGPTQPGEPAFLVLEYLPARAPCPDHDERLGRGLAALHRAGAPSFGLDHDNFIGRLPQRNDPAKDWVEFFADRRLGDQLRGAVDRGRASRAMVQGFDRLLARLPDLAGPPEPPARLHGDLWGGNLHSDDRGAPVLIDPAVYGGHREVDLAMMRLFGGFGNRVFAAYDEVFPLAPGHEQRISLYQLYPLLVHVNLFGGGYVASVERVLRQYG